MSEPSNPAIKLLDRAKTTTSRFTEDLDESSNQSSICQTRVHPTELIKRLKTERNTQRNTRECVQGPPLHWKTELRNRRPRRISGQTALAYERRRSVAKSLVETHKTIRDERRTHEKQHKKKQRLIGAV